jgi:Ca2+-binding RTX toxin-like protein
VPVQWQVSNAALTAFTNIAGATNATFTPVQAQTGRLIRVVSTFTDAHGTSETRTSVATAVVGDVITGTAGNDAITGTAGADDISGLGGNDRISGLGGGDVLSGGAGNDTITGGTGSDTVSGGAGADSITGGGGDDRIAGDAGDDAITLGAGADRIVYGTGAFGADTVTGFTATGPDRIDVAARGITAGTFGANVRVAVAPGQPGHTLVSIGTAATGGTIRLLNVAPAAVTAADFVLA